MEVSRGDVLVFAGSKEGSRLDSHFRNFKVGKSYVVSDVMRVGYDIDEMQRFDSVCVIFENEKYGCHLELIDLYFVRKDEWRDDMIDGILGKILHKIKKR